MAWRNFSSPSETGMVRIHVIGITCPAEILCRQMPATTVRLYRKHQAGQYSKSVIRAGALESDQPVFHPAKEVFGVHLGLFGGAGIVAVLEGNFLQSNLGGVLRLEAPGHQLSCSCR